MSAKTPPLQPLSRSKAWVCVAMNQLAFPGLGTVMAGRKIGYFQAAIMLAGFFLAMGFMLLYLIAVVRFLSHSEWNEAEYRALYRSSAWAGISGVALCLAAWCWAWFSSISILRSSSL